jgi:hypothetical protein
MWNKYLILILGCMLLGGCAKRTRSISHSGWQQQPSYCGDRNRTPSDPAFQYRGELNEFDVLGITRGELASEADIRHALDSARGGSGWPPAAPCSAHCGVSTAPRVGWRVPSSIWGLELGRSASYSARESLWNGKQALH